MSRVSHGSKYDTPGGIPNEEDLEWIVPVPAAVLALAPLTHRHLKKGCKKCTVKQEDGTSAEKLYVRLQGNKAVDLGWLGSKLPQHLLWTLISEQVPKEARHLHAARSVNHAGGRWTTYITMIINTMLMMGQIGQELALGANNVLEAEGKGPIVLADGLFLSLAVGLASCFPQREEGYGSDDLEQEVEGGDGAGPGKEEGERAAAGGAETENKGDAMQVDDAPGGAAAEGGAEGGEGGGEVKSEGAEAGREAERGAERSGEDEDSKDEDKEEDRAKDKHGDAGRWQPVDLVGVIMQILALFLRNEYKANAAAAPKGKGKGKGKGSEGAAGEEESPFLQLLARHDKVRAALVDGLFDSMGTFFDAMDNSSGERQNKTLVGYIANSIEVLYFCSWDREYVSELVVSDCMHQGRAFSMLKKVLLMDQAEVVSNMLRWLLRFSEYEDPPTQDILAGYQLDNRLLHSIIERNNSAMVAWGAKQPYNSLACDLLKTVEIFADDSNFKAQVVDSSAEALAVVLRRGAEYNGFGKADSMHLSFTYAFFKLLAALHCFNPQVMPADQEKHFVSVLAAECRTKEHREGVRGSLEFLLTLPEVIKRSKDNTCEPVLDEDLALVAELLEDFSTQCERGNKPSAPKAASKKAKGADKDKDAKDKGEEKAKGGAAAAKTAGKSSNSSTASSSSAAASAQRGQGRKRARNGEMWGMTEDEQMRLAIEASLQEQ